MKIYKDPVCGMFVPPETAAIFHQYGPDTYYFCSEQCKKKFSADPNKYLNDKNLKHTDNQQSHDCCDNHSAPSQNKTIFRAKADHDAIYTCPMHPEIEQHGPGSCPICGMALEPKEISLDTDTGELEHMRKRFRIGALLTLPIFFLAMGEMIFPHFFSQYIHKKLNHFIQLALTIPVVFWAGFDFLKRGWLSVKNLKGNMFTLIAIGNLTAFFFSAFLVFFGSQLGSFAHDSHGNLLLYFESAAVITVLVLLGQVLELRSRFKTSVAIRSLLQLRPNTAVRLKEHNGNAMIDENIDIADIQIGDILLIKAGEKISADGVVVLGNSFVDESMISGEPIASEKKTGDKVIAGTINQNSILHVRAEKTSNNTLLSKIVELIIEASRSQVKVQQLANKVSAIFVPIVLITSLLTFGVWYFLYPENLLPGIINAVAVLVIACPCALGLAAPMSVMVASGRAAKMGVLFRQASALETLAQVDTIVLDKTGTITEGKPKLIRMKNISNRSDNQLLQIAAALEFHSEHPLAKAILSEVKNRGLAMDSSAKNFQSTIATGISAIVGEKYYQIGNETILKKNNLSADLRQFIEQEQQLGHTCLYLLEEDQLMAILTVGDKIKDESIFNIQELKKQGYQLHMLSGDNQQTAKAIAAQCGIDFVRAETRPDEKYQYIRELKSQNRVVAMAGDGINDAAALALADVGIAMGNGSDIAMESADIVLVHGSLRGINRALLLSKKMAANIRQNLLFAFGYNVIGIPIAAGALYPVFGIFLSPMIAAAAMSLSSISVILNALRLNAFREKNKN